MKVIILFLAAQALVCCNRPPASLSKQELLKYIADKQNRLWLEQEVNGITVRLSYQPAPLLALQEMEAYDNKRSDSLLYKTLEEKYNKNYYFLLKFSKNSKEAIRQLGGFDRYSEILQVLSFRMGNFLYVTTHQRDTLPLSDYYFDQSYGMTDGNTLLLVFDRLRLKDEKQFDIHLQECGLGTGDLSFRFLRRDLLQVPHLEAKLYDY
ncbi:MAG: hypothetical protein KF746_10545 [Chitinophagaceae bacterium]|nr:hypothetical protein [Chitinophagaceae bacterium]